MFSKSKFDQVLPQFVTYLAAPKLECDFLLFEISKSWFENWDIDQLDFKNAYKNSLKSTISNRLWNTTGYQPKEILLQLIDYDKEYIRLTFIDLYDEAKTVDGRMQRFQHNMQQIFSNYEKELRIKKINHHQQDMQVISIYLMMNNPLKYMYWNEELFTKAMIKLGARSVPTVVGIESYHKVTSMLTRFLYESEACTQALKTRLAERMISHVPSNAFGYYFMEWVVSM